MSSTEPDPFDVVLVGGVPLRGDRALGDWQLARALAHQGHQVLYVDPPAFPRSAIRSRHVTSLYPKREQVAERLVCFRPVATPGANRPWGAPVGDAVIARQVRAAARHLTGRRVVLVFDPKRGTLPSLPRDLLVYWRRDRLALSANTDLPGHVGGRDRALVRGADLVTGVSRPLVDEVTGVARETLLVPNACDYGHFSPPRPPPDAFPTHRPVIGFAGGVSWRLDVDLLAAVAHRHPEWLFLLVGEVATAVPELPNIRVQGPVPYAELPAWVQQFDVAVIPYRRDSFNTAAAPLKLYEYLAAGVPVVSTPLPALDGLSPCVRTAGDPDGFAEAIARTLTARPRVDDCRSLARQNDWAPRVELLAERINGLLVR